MTERETLEERLANRRKPGDPDYDAFYDASDDELAGMVTPPAAPDRCPSRIAHESGAAFGCQRPVGHEIGAHISGNGSVRWLDDDDRVITPDRRASGGDR